MSNADRSSVTMRKEDQDDMMRVLGGIAAQEYDHVIMITEKQTPSGEWQTTARFGGITEAQAKLLSERVFATSAERTNRA